MIVTSIRTRIFKEGENLANFVCENIKKIPEKSIVVVTSKIVSLAENRAVSHNGDKLALIKKESDAFVKTKWAYLTLRDGALMCSAGIDASNGNGKYILFPKDANKSARRLYKDLKKIYKTKKFGVIITDSRITPLRSGCIASAVGYYGFDGIKNYKGKKDIFGRKFQTQKVNLADSLAVSAVVGMGEGNERRPLALIQNLGETGIIFSDKKQKNLSIPLKDDMFKKFFDGISRRTNNS